MLDICTHSNMLDIYIYTYTYVYIYIYACIYIYIYIYTYIMGMQLEVQYVISKGVKYNKGPCFQVMSYKPNADSWEQGN